MLRSEVYHQSVPLWWLSSEMDNKKSQCLVVRVLARQVLSDNVNWLTKDLWHPLGWGCYVKESVGCIVRMQKRTEGVAVFRRAIYESVTHRHVFIRYRYTQQW